MHWHLLSNPGRRTHWYRGSRWVVACHARVGTCCMYCAVRQCAFRGLGASAVMMSSLAAHVSQSLTFKIRVISVLDIESCSGHSVGPDESGAISKIVATPQVVLKHRLQHTQRMSSVAERSCCNCHRAAYLQKLTSSTILEQRTRLRLRHAAALWDITSSEPRFNEAMRQPVGLLTYGLDPPRNVRRNPVVERLLLPVSRHSAECPRTASPLSICP